MSCYKNNISIYGLFLAVILGVLSLLISPPAVSQQNPDFSGRWLFNVAKSDPGQGHTFLDARITLTIRQRPDSISITKTTQRPGSVDLVSREKYKLNGIVTLSPGKNQSKTVSTQWSEDGQTLIVSIDWIFNSESGSREINEQESYRLSNQGETLTVFSTSEDTPAENKMILVYDRVEK